MSDLGSVAFQEYIQSVDQKLWAKHDLESVKLGWDARQEEVDFWRKEWQTLNLEVNGFAVAKFIEEPK